MSRSLTNHFIPFVNDYCKEVGIDYKALVFIDNVPAHPTLEKLESSDGKVNTIFLPPNTNIISRANGSRHSAGRF